MNKSTLSWQVWWMSKTVHMVIKTRMLLQNQVMENQILVQKKAGLTDGGWVELQLGFQQTLAEEIEVEEHSQLQRTGSSLLRPLPHLSPFTLQPKITWTQSLHAHCNTKRKMQLLGLQTYLRIRFFRHCKKSTKLIKMIVKRELGSLKKHCNSKLHMRISY